MRLHRHRRLVGLAALGAAALAAFVLAYFEPQKLFIDDRVAEALPAAAAVSDTRPPETVSQLRARDLGAGTRDRHGGRPSATSASRTSRPPTAPRSRSTCRPRRPAARATASTIASSTSATSRATSAARTTRSPPACASTATAASSSGASASACPSQRPRYERSVEAARRSGDRPDAKDARPERRVTPEGHQGLRRIPRPGDPDGNRTK